MTVESEIGQRPVDRQAALAVAHYARLRRLCQLLLRDREEAEEVVQDVFVKVCEVDGASAAPRDWAAWLTRVTVNACRDRRRAGWWVRFRHRSSPIQDMALPSLGPGPLDVAVNGEIRRKIWAAFRQLPRRQREAFVLRYIEEYSTDDAAAILGVSPGSVKRHLFRAIRHIRAALGQTL